MLLTQPLNNNRSLSAGRGIRLVRNFLPMPKPSVSLFSYREVGSVAMGIYSVVHEA
jgi:hypothetical protein